ncbi:tRNA (N(6)-L-threonylcarbamoyladenosine(37)-C(2))-methylthiotransferase MtaB [Prosthecochloris sp. SCSIO W1101]|uniref:tRNA (N(6)-L-threonylcarbamoyladenosine(37)-C(2))- methylthiotransferase MtaB n=1 Tax=Prosthecochloris sp. SCSIO W1101 TaxID=2992242 RepID=UPI00223CBAF7|nr:tRNA (N(6)-L-threonylcarbamoyladenosine(37)-C(2))-methylthiotransferase MtaB [Prosthecochloris sp. SCSIO W1101]UZJ41919.1 tRNA (N(6)-L-threonylcarbamoyladenosine(37)-C(2))-methylthiotransferase MtaB [Prosthecochloris sp. SCSIO W1101]
MKKKRVFAKTLGCKLNYAETSAILESFAQEGWQISFGNEVPDLVIIHTCAVTQQAGQKSRQQIRKMIKKYPKSRVAAVGCYAQLNPESLENIHGVDVILGSEGKFNIQKYITDCDKAVYIDVNSPGKIKEAVPAHSLIYDKNFGRTRAFLKIQDGCDYGCAYCTIPLARGRSRSVPFERVIADAVKLAEAGYREIVLTGVNIADYQSGSATIVELLHELETVDVGRIRISSIEPDILSDKLIRVVASSSKIMPHFHLPLQSGSDNILSAMRRRYTSAGYRERFLKAIEAIPDCAIGADVITGYPGETEEHFQATLRFLEALPAAYLHVFTCSLRPETVLSKQISSGVCKKVHSEIARSRSKLLLDLAEVKQREFALQYVGKALDVLFEEFETVKNGEIVFSGYSENYLRVSVNVKDSYEPVEFVGSCKKVLIENMGEDLILEGRFVT